MAKGRAWRNRLLLLLAVSTFTLLIISGIMPNPFPAIWDWVNRDRPIASEVTWQERLGGRVTTVGQAGDTVAVDAGRQAQLRNRTSGRLGVTWSADWLTVAGTGSDAVVITGETFSRGYQVRDPRTGTVIHTDDDARAVWGYREGRLDLRCDGPRSCELRAYQPDAAQPLWRVHLAGAGSGVLGPDPDLAMARPHVPARVDDRAGAPERLPPLIGLPIDRNRMAVISTRTGELIEQVETSGDEVAMVVGERVVRSVATRRDGVCLLAVTAHDPITGDLVWGPARYNLRTITGGGCEQRPEAVASGAALLAVDQDGNELIIDANDGRVLWRGRPDERVQALSEHIAIVKGVDPTVRYAVRLGRADQPLWQRSVNEDAEVLLTGCGVVVADREPSRLHVWDSATGAEVVVVRTSARLAACTPDGLVLASGRSVGFVPFVEAAGDERTGGTK